MGSSKGYIGWTAAQAKKMAEVHQWKSCTVTSANLDGCYNSTNGGGHWTAKNASDLTNAANERLKAEAAAKQSQGCDNPLCAMSNWLGGTWEGTGGGIVNNITDNVGDYIVNHPVDAIATVAVVAGAIGLCAAGVGGSSSHAWGRGSCRCRCMYAARGPRRVHPVQHGAKPTGQSKRPELVPRLELVRRGCDRGRRVCRGRLVRPVCWGAHCRWHRSGRRLPRGRG